MTFILKSLIFIALASETAFASQGGISGGGGDPLRLYFLKGQELAAAETKNASDQLLGMASHRTGANWISHHREELAEEIESLRLTWEDPDSNTCAYTEYRHDAMVRLSFANCRSISTPEEAGKILIHEAAHHLGVAEHAFADDIALAVTEAWERAKVLTVPLCPNAQNYVATLIPGSWIIDLPLLQRLFPIERHLSEAEIVYTEDAQVAKNFPPLGRCAASAGYLTLSGFDNKPARTYPAVLVELNGNINLVWYEGPHEDGSPDLESSILTGARAEDTANDLLLMGDDFNEAGTIPFKRK